MALAGQSMGPLALYPSFLLDQSLDKKEVKGDMDGACKAIHEACKGWGTDEAKLIATLGCRTATERVYINRRYPQLYNGKDLDDMIKSECSGNFGFAMRLFSMPPDEADVAIVRKCCEGLGTSEHLLFSVLCGRTNAEIDHLKKLYYKTHDRDLGVYLTSELSGDYERLIFNALQGIEDPYNEKIHTHEKAVEDAVAFYKAGQGKFFGTNEKAIFKVLSSSPAQHLRNMDTVYADKYGYTLKKAIEKEIGGAAGAGALYIVGMKLKPVETAAKLIYKACAGIGTDEVALTSHIVRFQPILKQVDQAHRNLYQGKGILDRVKSEVSGDYKKLLVSIIEHSLAQQELEDKMTNLKLNSSQQSSATAIVGATTAIGAAAVKTAVPPPQPPNPKDGAPQGPMHGAYKEIPYGAPQQLYGAPLPQYGAPQQPIYGAPHPQYGAPQQPIYGAPPPQYGAPQQPVYGAPPPQYGAPQQPMYGAPQQPMYGAPQQPTQYGAPQQPIYGAPPPQYGAPQQPMYGAPQQPMYGAPQQPMYGAPQQPQYGAPPPQQYGQYPPQYGQPRPY